MKKIFSFILVALFSVSTWADTAGMYQCDLTYSYNGEESTVTTSTTSTNLETPLNATLKVTAVKLYFWYYNNDYDGQYGNVCGGLMAYNLTGGDCDTEYTMGDEASWNDDGWVSDSRHKQITITRDLTIASPTSPSGNYTFNYCFKGWGSKSRGDQCGDNWWLSNNSANYALNYKVAPPAVDNPNIEFTGSNIQSGNGISSDPFVIAYNGSLVLTLSGEQAHTDANSELQYWTNDEWNTTSSRTISNITSSEVTSITVKMRYHNSTASLSGAETTQTIYYKSAGAPTALDNVVEEGKVVKRIENGQLIIIKNGVKYNALGAEVK